MQRTYFFLLLVSIFCVCCNKEKISNEPVNNINKDKIVDSLNTDSAEVKEAKVFFGKFTNWFNGYYDSEYSKVETMDYTIAVKYFKECDLISKSYKDIIKEYIKGEEETSLFTLSGLLFAEPEVCYADYMVEDATFNYKDKNHVEIATNLSTPEGEGFFTYHKVFLTVVKIKGKWQLDSTSMPISEDVKKEANVFFKKFVNWYNTEKELESSLQDYKCSSAITSIESADLVSKIFKNNLKVYVKEKYEDTLSLDLSSLLFREILDPVETFIRTKKESYKFISNHFVIITAPIWLNEEEGKESNVTLFLEKRRGKWIINYISKEQIK